ncbi:hypothetical protein [Sinomonas halotolerans]|uniref:Uncharacterized protein n=1 Tax=Sinomonas halotolerans TaxID=1644133 RepID=A0ABU9WYI0_9MICC
MSNQSIAHRRAFAPLQQQGEAEQAVLSWGHSETEGGPTLLHSGGAPFAGAGGFGEVGQTLRALGEHLEELSAGIETLRALGSHAAAAPLHAAAVGEAGRVLILLDFARLGARLRARAAQHWADPLARIAYAAVNSSSPEDLNEVRRIILLLRSQAEEQRALDPDLEQWFRLVRFASGAGAFGHVPHGFGAEDPVGAGRRWPGARAIRLVLAMHRLGLLTPAGARATADVWGPTSSASPSAGAAHAAGAASGAGAASAPGTASAPAAARLAGLGWEDVWRLNAEVLDRAAPEPLLTGDALCEAVRTVLDHWAFPVLGLDLSPAPRLLTRHRHRQARRSAPRHPSRHCLHVTVSARSVQEP